MPQLGQYKWIADIVFFLYPSEEHAREGRDAGGTGFLVALPSKRWPDHLHHVHGVSNKHVVCKDGCSVIRFNRKDGSTDVAALDPSEWQFIPSYHDIAVSPPLTLDPKIHKVEALGPDYFLDEEYISDNDIGLAEEVFMIGRFIDYDGVTTNRPAFRFGHISMMGAPIRQHEGFCGPSIVVDMHSRTGHSGSPVFVYRTPGTVFSKVGTILTGGHILKLLGIHWGQFPEQWELRSDDRWRRESHLITDGKYVQGLSGMTCVCPSSGIRRVLEMPALSAMREFQESRCEREMWTEKVQMK